VGEKKMTRSINTSTQNSGATPPVVTDLPVGSDPAERVIFTEGHPVPLSRTRTVVQWAVAHHLLFARATEEQRAAKHDQHARNARLVHRYDYLERSAMAREMGRL
jgi:hypothetical protein